MTGDRAVFSLAILMAAISLVCTGFAWSSLIAGDATGVGGAGVIAILSGALSVACLLATLPRRPR